jgi:2',3'-cyclic-nucleotide 2'-phosphodiesterase
VKILMIGDVISEGGRKAVAANVRVLREERGIDLVTANVENLAGGFGVSDKHLRELKEAGVDVFTSGNHIWDKKDVEACWPLYPTLLRPANYPSAAPGRGEVLFTTRGGDLIGVLNIMGRSFMPVAVDDPFLCAKAAVSRLKAQGAKAIVIDIHAETTSEKIALWRYLDGEASVIAGTHTHIPTADGRIGAKGTAYISDLGMTGSYAGIIGVQPESVMRKFLLGLNGRHTPSEGEVEFWAFYVELNGAGKATKVELIHKKLD